jgi:membrane-associated phospholipid phosphatase
MKSLLTVLAAVALPYPVLAQATTASLTPSFTTPTVQKTLPRPTQIAMTAGGFFLLSALLDKGVHAESQEWRGEASDEVARVAKEMGNGKILLPAFGAAWLAGKAIGSERLADVAGHTLQAGVAAGLVATGVKFLTGRQRPNSGMDADHFTLFRTGDTSFPSGHTAIAFSVAGALSNEIPGPWDDVGLYGLATATGLSRINDNKHWLTDVVAGAAVGIVAGRWATREHRAGTTLVAVPGGLGFSIHF